jgi:hypothetical protein
MRAKEFITEIKISTLSLGDKKALPAVYTISALPNNDFYPQYRFGVAMAGAKGAKENAKQNVNIKPYAASTEWGENMIVTDYMDPNLGADIDIALGELGLKGKKLITTSTSEDPAGKTISPVKPFKGYPK